MILQIKGWETCDSWFLYLKTFKNQAPLSFSEQKYIPTCKKYSFKKRKKKQEKGERNHEISRTLQRRQKNKPAPLTVPVNGERHAMRQRSFNSNSSGKGSIL